MPVVEVPTSVGPVIIQTFQVEMDSIENFDVGVEAGKYAVNPKIVGLNFPFERQYGRVDLAKLFFKQRVYYSEVVRGVSEIGLLPATTVELLAFGAQHPQEQLRNWIAEIDSVQNGPDGISYILELGSSLDRGSNQIQRDLTLGWTAYKEIELEFEQRSRFLARFRDPVHVQEILEKYAA